MKRTFLAVLSASLLPLAAPGIASAHHGAHHAACRTHRHHAKCAHARAHVLSFGPNFSAPSTTTPGSAPATAPSSTETAGTVTSYIAPILTITLNDKKTEVSGKVTEKTRIECESPTPTSTGGGEEGDDNSGTEGGGDHNAGMSGHGDSMVATAADTQDSQDQGDDQGEDSSNVQPCTTSALMPGTVVRSAELLLGNEGAVWERVLLVS